MKNIENCNALKCLKPSRLFEWVKCRLCNGWVRIKLANLSGTEDWRHSEFKCCWCSLVNTIPQCHGDNFRPDTFFNSGVAHSKSVPKRSRIPLGENLIPKTKYICETSSSIALCCLLLSSLSVFFLEKPPRGGKRQRSSLSANINKRVRDGVIEKKPKRDKKSQQKAR